MVSLCVSFPPTLAQPAVRPPSFHLANEQGNLFADLPPPAGKTIKFTPARRPLWTENKARLIERYLFYFVLITKHGAYIDGFAGPQNPKAENGWAAKLVLESKPPLLREFWLCELNKNGLAALEKMKAALSVVRGRAIEIVSGDFNDTVHDVLRRCKITENTASFCLLDQRTFECHWRTVETLAKFKKGGHKIELFYFLATGWLDRSLKGTTRNVDQIERWWGNADWKQLRGGDLDAVLKKMFRVRGETRRINEAEKLGQPDYHRLGLAGDFQWAVRVVRYCLEIRNQYAHWVWWDDNSGKLAFANLEDLAQRKRPVRDLTKLKAHHVDAALLEAQEAYFVYADEYLAWVNYEGCARGGKLKHGNPLHKPKP
jgi:three-Cys-motif partner protein